MASPFDLEAALSVQQAGPTAAPRVVRSNPFSAVQTPTDADRARGGAMGAAGSDPVAIGKFFQAERTEKIRNIGQKLVFDRIQELQGQGLSGSKMLNAIIASDEFAQAISAMPAEEIMGFVQNTVKALSPAPLETQIVRPGEELVGIGPDGRIAPGQRHRTPTTEEQNIAAIVDAEKRGDSRTATLLRQRLLTKDDAGETSVGDALKLRAAGVAKTGNSRVDGMTAAQSQSALQAARADPVSMPTNVLIARSLGKETPDYPAINRMAPEEAEAIVETQRDLHGTEKFEEMLFKSILGRGAGGPAAVPGFDKGRKSISERREALRKKATAPGGFNPADMSDEELNSAAQAYTSGKSPMSEADAAKLADELERREKRGK